jgi:hypothetical protein
VKDESKDGEEGIASGGGPAGSPGVEIAVFAVGTAK